MYHEFTHCGLVTLTVTMLVSVLPPVLLSANITTSSPYVSTTSISEPTTSNITHQNVTLAVLLSQSTTAVTPKSSSSSTESSTQSVTSSYTFLSSLSSPPVNRSETVSQNTLTLSEATQNSSLLPTNVVTSSTAASTTRSMTESTTGQSRLEIVLVKKLLQKWGYMPIKKNGCWVYRDWRKEDEDQTGVSCSSSQSTSDTTTTVSSVPVTYDSISELATSDFPEMSKESTSGEEEDLSQEEQEKFHSGMMVYQETFQLPVTGRLDLPTARVIRQRVCGVPDSPVRIQINNKTSSLPDDEDRINPVSEGPSVQTSTVLNTILRGHDVTSRPTPSEYETVTDMVSATMEVDYALTEIVTGTSSDVSSVTENEAASPTTSLERRSTISVSPNNRPTSAAADSPRLKRRSLAEYFPSLSLHRVKRFDSSPASSQCSSFAQYFNGLTRPIRWRIEKKDPSDSDSDPKTDSTDFTNSLLRTVISQAFRRWAEVSTLKFEERLTGSASQLDIKLRFISDGYVGVCTDGCFSASEMAVTSFSNNQVLIYFRDTSQHPWSYQSSSSSTRDLLTVAVHEIGHALCLGHNSGSGSVMSPSYIHPQHPYRVRIDNYSRQQVQNLYGSCTGHFVGFDWVRYVLNENGIYVRKYSSFFFRQRYYWLWENSNTRTRYGDPKLVTASNSDWRNAYKVGTNLQAIVHTTPKGSTPNQFEIFFLAGGRSMKYNPNTHTVIANQSISTAFGAKIGGEVIPVTIKAAYFDKTNGNIYFFNHTHVFAYDTSLGQNGCCETNYPKKIGEAYPGVQGGASLETGIDGAYYSIAERRLYFFKGNCYWESTYDPVTNGGSNVKVKAKVCNKHNKWSYICDV